MTGTLSFKFKCFDWDIILAGFILFGLNRSKSTPLWITLILPTPAAGLNYKFIIVATNTNAVTIKSSSDGTKVTNLMMGSITVNNDTQNVTSAADELVFVAGAATIGDIAEVVCDGTNWFWNATGAEAGSIILS